MKLPLQGPAVRGHFPAGLGGPLKHGAASRAGIPCTAALWGPTPRRNLPCHFRLCQPGEQPLSTESWLLLFHTDSASGFTTSKSCTSTSSKPDRTKLTRDSPHTYSLAAPGNQPDLGPRLGRDGRRQGSLGRRAVQGAAPSSAAHTRVTVPPGGSLLPGPQ